MPFCRDCGASVADSDKHCSACGAPVATSEAEAAEGQTGRRRVEAAYPALRLRRYRRAGLRARGRPSEGGADDPFDGAEVDDPEPRSRARRRPEPLPPIEEDMEAATVVSRPSFTDAEDQGDVKSKTTARDPLLDDEAPYTEPEGDSGGARRRITGRYSGLRRAIDREEAADWDAPPEPRRRGDALVDNPYSRTYDGADGWGPDGLRDSVAYLFRVLRGKFKRSADQRKLRKQRDAKQKALDDQLVELGEAALRIPDIDTSFMPGFRRQLEALHAQREELRDQIDLLEVQMEERRREANEAVGELDAKAEAIKTKLSAYDTELRPLENDYTRARKKSRDAESEARALARQIDHAKSELQRNAATASTAELARVKAKIERWTEQREGLKREAPKLEEAALSMEPEIERLRKDIEAAKEDLRLNHADVDGVQAALKRDVGKLQDERDKLRVEIDSIAADERELYHDCGEQLDIERPRDEALVDFYADIDDTNADLGRIGEGLSIAEAELEPWDTNATVRACVVLFGGFFLLFLLLYLVATA